MMIPFGDEYRIAGTITLMLFVPIWFYIIQAFKDQKRLSWVMYGYSFLMLSTLFGVLRELSFFTLFRELEQFSIFLAGLVFAYGSYLANKRLRGEK